MTFRTSEEKECEKAKKLIELVLSVKIKAIVLEDSTATLSEGNASSPQYPEKSVTVDGSETCITSGVARPGPTRACALPSTSQALPSPTQNQLIPRRIRPKFKKIHIYLAVLTAIDM